MNTRRRDRQFALCVKNDGYPASLELKKVYEVSRDPSEQSQGLLRVVDESGESYLYPADYFVGIEIPAAAAKVFSTAT